MITADMGTTTVVKGVIFDLDGTLIDSMLVWSQVDRIFLRECGVENPPSDISERVRKMTVQESAEYFISEFGINRTPEFIIQRIEELVRCQYEQHIPLKPDVPEVLDFLDKKGIIYGVATATYKNLAEAVLRRCGIINRFRFVLTDEEYPVGKTSPDIFLGAAERLELPPEEILVAEDSLHCIETAADAGFFTVGVYDSVSEGDAERIKEKADAYVMRLGEICKFI
jgi:HAD superfamily hydrolase (TIGR01509 family)